MDVTALYPSISKELAMKSIMRSMNKSTIPWDDIDIDRLGRYISLTADSKSIKEAKLTECIPIPKSRTSLNSYTNPTKNSRALNGDNQFTPPTVKPTGKQISTMIGLGIAQCVKVIMENHFYTFGSNCKTYR